MQQRRKPGVGKPAARSSASSRRGDSVRLTCSARPASPLSLWVPALFTIVILGIGLAAIPSVFGYDLVYSYRQTTAIAALVLPVAFGALHHWGPLVEQRQALWKHPVFFLLGAIAHHAIFILFGAPFFNKATDTFQAACILTALTTLPMGIVIGQDPNRWVYNFLVSRKHTLPEAWVTVTALGAYVGTWASAVMIPLDWGTAYQVWPIPCTIGACGGHTLASILYLGYISIGRA